MGEGRAVEGRQASPPVCLARPLLTDSPTASSPKDPCRAQISIAKPLSNRELELLEPRLTRRKQTIGPRSNRELSTNPCFCISDLHRAFTGHSFTQTKKGPLTASHWSFLPGFASRVEIAVTHSKQSVETFLPGPRIACRLRQGTAFYPYLRKGAV